MEFYCYLYRTDSSIIPSDLKTLVEKVITEEDNAMLTWMPDRIEIWETLKKMHPDKAPGPDGMTVFFFCHF